MKRKPSMALERRLKLVTRGETTPEMNTAVKVAFATSDMKRVNQHFGAAESFAVYALNSGQATLTEAVQFGPEVLGGYESNGWREDPTRAEKSGPASVASGHNEDKLAARIDALGDCVAVYCQAVGASAINQLRLKGIQAVRVHPDAEIRDLLVALQEELRAGARTWFVRAFARHQPCNAHRFDDMEQEGWVE